jgi:hypothetical protein
MDGMFSQKIRGKIAPGNLEGGFADVGPDANAASLSDAAREDVAVNVVNPPAGRSEAKGLR